MEEYILSLLKKKVWGGCKYLKSVTFFHFHASCSNLPPEFVIVIYQNDDHDTQDVSEECIVT